MSGPTLYNFDGDEIFTTERPGIVQLGDLMIFIHEMRQLYQETLDALRQAQTYHYYRSIDEFRNGGNDAQAFKNAMENTDEFTLVLKDGVTYDLSNWNTITLSKSMAIVGLNKNNKPTIKGNDLVDMMKTTKNIVFKNIHFQDWGIVLNLNDLTSTIENVSFENCSFGNIRSCVYSLFDTKDGALIKNFVFKNSVVKQSRTVAIGLTCRIDRVVIENNEFDDIVFRCISIGNNAPNPSLVPIYKDYWKNVHIANNKITNVHRATVGELQAIIVYGWRVIIKNNTVEDVYNGDVNAKDCEGIYTKARYVTISDNILINASGEQGAINVKGQPRGLFSDPSFSPESYGIVVTQNKIVSRRPNSSGIHFQSADIIVSKNYIEGVSYRGIWSSASESGNVMVTENEIVDMEGRQGIYLRTVGENIVIKNNIINNLKGVFGSLRSVGIQLDLPSGYDSSRFKNYQIVGNTIQNLLLKGDDDWGIRIGSSGGIMKNVLIGQNSLDNMTNGIYLATSVGDADVHHNMIDNIVNVKVSVNKTFTNAIFTRNKGFITHNRNSTVLLNNTSSVTVPHGLAMQPPNYGILVTPRTNLNGLSYYVTNITATTFDIILNNVTPNSIAFTFDANVN